MTDRTRTAGWAAAAVLGPVAAAVFAGTTAWSAAHAPAPPSTDATSITGPEAAGGDHQQIIDDTARIADLEHLVATLRAQTALLVPGPAGARAVPGSSGAAATAAPTVRTGSQPPITARAAARPPSVHAVTGASSAAKGKP